MKQNIIKYTCRLSAILALNICVAGGAYSQESNPLLREVIVNYDSIVSFQGANSTEGVFTLGSKMNNLIFILENDKAEASYSFMLTGFDTGWSPWFRAASKEYTNLRPGKYSLMTRRQSGSGIVTETEILSFRIKPVFYATIWFLPVYLFTAFIIMVIVLRLQRLVKTRRDERLEEIINERTEKLQEEKDKTDSLLANLLPKGTADEIKTKGKAEKHKFNFVTVLFSDIQGFTKIAEEINPEILIDELDQFFFQFDSVVDKYNIEKIKTIGDAYMCAGGIPTQNRTNPIEVILSAIEMQNYMQRIKVEKQHLGKVYWDIRIGIHTGPVVAGVVGQKKLSYDIWGDTVNTASRMESSGEAGKINISGVTYEYAKEFFICEYRGRMPVKYKGELDMYFVNGVRPELRDESGSGPNETFLTRMALIKLGDLEEVVYADYTERTNDKYVFHNVRFLKNVYTQAELIARAEMIGDPAMLRLQLASLFILSDIMAGEEMDAGKLLTDYATEWGFDNRVIEDAVSILKDSKEKRPSSTEGMILRDAIFDYYGRVDYLRMTELLFEEESVTGKIKKQEWFKNELDKLKEHKFLTGTAKLLRSVEHQEQVRSLSDYISFHL